MDHGQLMDHIYRYQRSIYDLTRKYYLVGRDRLLDRIRAAPGDRVLEVGCGTGRNLMIMAEKKSGYIFFSGWMPQRSCWKRPNVK